MKKTKIFLDQKQPPSQNLGPLFNKDLGQHILKNPLVANSIVDKADLSPSDTVLEVGPGTGNLTVRILERCKSLIAVEKDPRLAAELLKRVQGSPAQRKLTLIVDDFLQTTGLPDHFDVVISNTPYQISSPLVFRLLQQPGWRSAVLMFQREFALRLIARPGDALYSRLSVNVQLLATVEHVMKIGKNNFRPPPKVESSVVVIRPRKPGFGIAFGEWDGMVRVCFVRKNKTIAANFKCSTVVQMLLANYGVFQSETGGGQTATECEIKEKIEKVLQASGLAQSRASKMSLEDFMKLLSAFHDENLHFS